MKKRIRGRCSSHFLYFLLGREHLLSKIPVNPTVGFLRAKKERCSTQRRQHVDPILRSFHKIREVGVLSYLFYPLFKCFVNICVGLSGHLISPKS